MPASRTDARRRFTPLALALAVGLAASLTGCDRGSSDATAVRTASDRLIAASGNGAAGTSAESRSAAYAAIVSEMQRVESSSSNPGLKASAAILGARALIGQGELAAEECRDVRIAALLEIARLRSLALLRQDMLSLEGALSEFDPTQDLSDLDAVSREIAVESAAIRTRIEELSGGIEEVLGQVGERMERARQLREQDSTIRLASANLGASERAKAVTQATGIRREADLLEKRASELELQAAALETTRVELQAVAQSLDERASTLAAARVRLQDSSKMQLQQAQQAQRSADEFRTELTDGFLAVQAGAIADMLAAHDAGASKYSAAAAKAGTARSVDATGAALTTAVAKQSSADLHRNVAQAIALAAALAENIGAEEAAAELAARYEELILAAGDDVDQAASAYQSVRVVRDQATTDALTNLSESLRREAMRLRGEPEPADDAGEIDQYIEEEVDVESAPEAEPEPEPELDPETAPAADPETDPEPATDPE